MICDQRVGIKHWALLVLIFGPFFLAPLSHIINLWDTHGLTKKKQRRKLCWWLGRHLKSQLTQIRKFKTGRKKPSKLDKLSKIIYTILHSSSFPEKKRTFPEIIVPLYFLLKFLSHPHSDYNNLLYSFQNFLLVRKHDLWFIICLIKMFGYLNLR